METRWQPDADGLAQIVQLLKESQCSDTRIQQTVQQVSYEPTPVCWLVVHVCTQCDSVE